MAGKKVYAFAGIGRPGKFFATLAGIGADIVGLRAEKDHYAYTGADVEAILAAAADLGAIPVTTEKDAVRLPGGFADRVHVVAILVAWEDEEQVDKLLDGLMAGRGPAP